MKLKDTPSVQEEGHISRDSTHAILDAYIAVTLKGERDGWGEDFQRDNFQRILDLVARCRAIPADSSILDVGCGTAKLAHVWNENGGQQYLGVDLLSPGRVALQELMDVHPDFYFMHGEFTRLQLPPADFVVASGSLTIGAPEDKYAFIEQYLRKMLELAKKGVYFNYWEEDHVPVSDIFLTYDSKRIDQLVALLMERYGFKVFHRDQDPHPKPSGVVLNNHVFIQKE